MIHAGEILIYKVDQNAKTPMKAHLGDAGYDLYVSRKTVLKPRAFTDVPTGVHVAMPHGIWGRITGRSSTVRKLGLQVQHQSRGHA